MTNPLAPAAAGKGDMMPSAPLASHRQCPQYRGRKKTAEEDAMKFLKWLLIVVLALAAVVLVGGMLLSPKFTVTRSVVINAPPEKIYPLIASPRQWTQWSVWNRRDPAMQITYSGPDSGAGAAWAWKSKTEGDGRMTFTTAEPNRKIDYELFFPDFETASTGTLSLAPESGSTRVNWTMNGDFGSNPLFRWFALAADRMVGKDFDAGLANLKTIAEKP
jgi:uncharacterized protein YndB with AHSA1/START domain